MLDNAAHPVSRQMFHLQSNAVSQDHHGHSADVCSIQKLCIINKSFLYLLLLNHSALYLAQLQCKMERTVEIFIHFIYFICLSWKHFKHNSADRAFPFSMVIFILNTKSKKDGSLELKLRPLGCHYSPIRP